MGTTDAKLNSGFVKTINPPALDTLILNSQFTLGL